jgi:hypothetical protein
MKIMDIAARSSSVPTAATKSSSTKRSGFPGAAIQVYLLACLFPGFFPH